MIMGTKMNFTDDDLKQLKERQANESGMDFDWFEIDNDVLCALLARLEASEAYARYGGLLHGGKSAECVIGKCDMCKAKEAWRKACGR